MKLFRRRGVLRLRLDALERSVLAAMLVDLAAALEPGALHEDDPVRRRLYPAGYSDDDAAAAEFRALTEESLGAQRLRRVRDCLGQLDAGNGTDDATDSVTDNATDDTFVDVTLDGEAGTAWITTLNDLRLAVGTRLGIEDEEHDEVDPDDPLAPQWAAYYWLTGLQDGLVRKLMAS